MTANKASIPIRIHIKKEPSKDFDTSKNKSFVNNLTSSMATVPNNIQNINTQKIEREFQINSQSKIDILTTKKPIKRIQNLSPIKPSFVK